MFRPNYFKNNSTKLITNPLSRIFCSYQRKKRKEMTTEFQAKNPKQIVDKLWFLKNQRKFCDAEIIVNDQRIPVHAVVMASSSEFFESAFFENAGPTKEVTFKDVDLDVLEVIIEYCYTGIIKIVEKKADEIFQIAGVLSMTEIFEKYSKVLDKKLNVGNCLSIWKIAKAGNLKNLVKTALDMSRKNFEEVSRSKEFLELKFSDINELLSADVNVTSETFILEAIEKWINLDKPSRNKHLYDLLDHIKLECLPKNVLTDKSLSLCDDLNNECFKKFMKAIQKQGSMSDTDKGKCAHGQIRANNTLIAVGNNWSETTKYVDIYDIIKGKWNQITIEFNKSCFHGMFLDNKLMTIGGYSSGAVKTVEYYDLITGKKESLPPMKYPRYNCLTVKCNDYIYAIGGYNSGSVTHFERWDPKSKSWKELTPMPTARYGNGAVAIKNEIFIIGGNVISSKQYFSKVEAYDTVSNKWRLCQPMQEERQAPGVAAIGDHIYVVGGYNKTGYLKTAERYDYKNQNWTSIQSITIPRYWFAAGNLNGQLVIAGGNILGGNVSDGVLTIVERYNDETDKWELMTPMNKRRWVFSLVEIPWDEAQQILSKNISK